MLPHRAMSSIKIVLFFLLSGSISAVSAQTDPPVLRHQLTAFSQLDARRSIESDFALRAEYGLIAWDLLRGTVGLSLSFTPPCIDAFFLDLGVDNAAGTGLGARVALTGAQFPEYGRAVNAIRPYLVWRWKILDLAFGVTWRFLILPPAAMWWPFTFDSPVVEAVFYYKIGVVLDFFHSFWTLSVSLSNQDEFYAGSFGAFELLVGNALAIDRRWSLFLDCIYRPAGTIALTAANSVFSFRLGGRMSL